MYLCFTRLYLQKTKIIKWWLLVKNKTKKQAIVYYKEIKIQILKNILRKLIMKMIGILKKKLTRKVKKKLKKKLTRKVNKKLKKKLMRKTSKKLKKNER